MRDLYKTFKFTPKGDVKRSVRFLDRTIEFESGSFQTQRVGVNPIITFDCEFEGNGKSLCGLENFYLKHRKTEKFYFWYNDKRYVVKFTSDYNPTETWGWDENGRVIGRLTVSLSMRVVNE